MRQRKIISNEFKTLKSYLKKMIVIARTIPSDMKGFEKLSEVEQNGVFDVIHTCANILGEFEDSGLLEKYKLEK